MPPFSQKYFFFFICWQQLCPKQINIVVHTMKLFLDSNLELKLLGKWFSSRFWVHIQEPFFLFISSQFTRHKKKVGEKTTFLTFTYLEISQTKKKRSIRPLDKKKKKQRKKLLLCAWDWKKSFFLKHTWFCWSPFRHHFQRCFFQWFLQNGSLWGAKNWPEQKKKLTSKTAQSQRFF